MIVKKHCDTHKIVNFVPLTYRVQEKEGVRVKKLVPVVHNLIFIKGTRHLINELKMRFPLRYIMDQSKDCPITIPEQEMEHFITVARQYDQQIVYLDPSDVKMKVGTKVRVSSGVFKGVEGTLLRIRKNKRVVVQIQGLLVVATHYVHPTLLENIGS